MRPLEDIQIKPSACAYYMFISLMIINDGLGNSLLPGYSDGPVQQLFLLAELGFAVLCLFLQCNSRPSLTFFAGVFGVSCAAYLFGGRTGLLLTLLAAALGRSAKADTLLKLVFWEKLFVFLLIVGLSIAGALPGREALLELSNAEVKGATLGYTHANTFSATVVMLLLLYVAINRHRLSLVQMLIVGAVELVNYALTRSRIGLVVVFLLLVGALCVRNRWINKLVKHTSKVFLLLILLINFGFVLLRLFADSEMLSAVDIKVFNGRMGFSAMYLETYGISVFGAVLDEALIAAKSWYYALDNGYTIILLYYGVAGLAAFLLVYQKAVLELAKRQEIVLVLIAMCFMIWMMFEGITLTASGNFVFLLLGKEFSQAKTRNRRLAW